MDPGFYDYGAGLTALDALYERARALEFYQRLTVHPRGAVPQNRILETPEGAMVSLAGRECGLSYKRMLSLEPQAITACIASSTRTPISL